MAEACRVDRRQRDRCVVVSGFPRAAPQQIAHTNPLERLNKEVKRRADVVGIFPNEAAIIRLIGAVLLEQNDEWQLLLKAGDSGGPDAFEKTRHPVDTEMQAQSPMTELGRRPEGAGEPLSRARDMRRGKLQHRYMQVEVMAELASAAGADDPRRIPGAA